MKTSYLDFAMLLSLFMGVSSFSHNSLITQTRTQTQLFAEDPARSPERRSVLDNLKRVVIGTATLAAFRPKPAPVSAEELMASPGRTVQLEITNLGGVEGETGIVKIKLQPEWAPRGVSRFEVSIHAWIFCNTHCFFGQF